MKYSHKEHSHLKLMEIKKQIRTHFRENVSVRWTTASSKQIYLSESLHLISESTFWYFSSILSEIKQEAEEA